MFSLDRCSVVSPQVFPGDWVAYYTEIGGRGNGRWLRCLVIRMNDDRRLLALDEEDDPVVLARWEKVSSPPKLKPAVLRNWLRTMAFYPRKPEQMRMAL